MRAGAGDEDAEKVHWMPGSHVRHAPVNGDTVTPRDREWHPNLKAHLLFSDETVADREFSVPLDGVGVEDVGWTNGEVSEELLDAAARIFHKNRSDGLVAARVGVEVERRVGFELVSVAKPDAASWNPECVMLSHLGMRYGVYKTMCLVFLTTL